MTWALSLLGNVHWYERDALGYVSRCGKSRPELPPKPAPTGATPCAGCVLLFAGRQLRGPAHDPAPEQHANFARREDVGTRLDAIRRHVALNPEQSMAAVAAYFCTVPKAIQNALRPTRGERAPKAPAIEALLKANPKASITAISRKVGCTVTYVQQIRARLRVAQEQAVRS